MRISEFVIGRNVEKQAVYRYINRHEELLEKCTKDGKELDVPMEVIAELEKQYPLAKPNVIINGVPDEEHREVLNRLADSNEQLAKAKDMMLEMQKMLSTQQLLVAEQKGNLALLEDRESRLEEENERLKAELEREKSKTWFQKLCGK